MNKLSDFQVAGAMTLPQGKAAFDRASLVLETLAAPAQYLQVTAYLEDGGVDGKRLSGEEYQALQRSGQAIAFSERFAAGAGLALWVLRPSFPGREAALQELRASEVLLRDYLALADGSFGCLVRERPAALALRDRWAQEAHEQARRWAIGASWERAREAASRAFVLERAMSPERLAMLMLVCARQGQQVRADGYLRMARQSRSQEFAAQIEDHLRELEASLAVTVPASRLPARAEMQRANQRHVSSGLGRIGRQRQDAA